MALTFDAAKGIRFTLLLQGFLAALLLLSDADFRWTAAINSNPALPTGPISPGDQVREFAPKVLRPAVTKPTEAPHIPVPESMPNRLTFVEITDKDALPLLLVNGEISEGDSVRFSEFLANSQVNYEVVAFNSSGGLVMEALNIGRQIRKANLSTIMLPGMLCLSSCPYMLAGGTSRTVSLNSAVGLHQHYYDVNVYLPFFLAVEEIQHSHGDTLEYLIEMGVDPSLLLFALKTPPDEIYILVEDELIDTGMATKIIDTAASASMG